MRCVIASQTSVIRRGVSKAIKSSPPASHLLSLFLLSSLRSSFFLLRRGSRLEVEDLMWVADKVTTILSNASSDRIHVRTLIGIAQLFYDFREAVAPTNLLLLGLPWSVACAEIF